MPWEGGHGTAAIREVSRHEGNFVLSEGFLVVIPRDSIKACWMLADADMTVDGTDVISDS